MNKTDTLIVLLFGVLCYAVFFRHKFKEHRAECLAAFAIIGMLLLALTRI